MGAVAVKQSIYLLPNSEQALEDLSWILKEVIDGGGEASISAASFLEGMTDRKAEELFREARDADYRQLAGEAGALARSMSGEEQGGAEIIASMASAVGPGRSGFPVVDIIEIRLTTRSGNSIAII